MRARWFSLMALAVAASAVTTQSARAQGRRETGDQPA